MRTTGFLELGAANHLPYIFRAISGQEYRVEAGKSGEEALQEVQALMPGHSIQLLADSVSISIDEVKREIDELDRMNAREGGQDDRVITVARLTQSAPVTFLVENFLANPDPPRLSDHREAVTEGVKEIFRRVFDGDNEKVLPDWPRPDGVIYEVGSGSSGQPDLQYWTIIDPRHSNPTNSWMKHVTTQKCEQYFQNLVDFVKSSTEIEGAVSRITLQKKYGVRSKYEDEAGFTTGVISELGSDDFEAANFCRTQPLGVELEMNMAIYLRPGNTKIELLREAHLDYQYHQNFILYIQF